MGPAYDETLDERTTLRPSVVLWMGPSSDVHVGLGTFGIAMGTGVLLFGYVCAESFGIQSPPLLATYLTLETIS